jgi:hypothetical protein
MEKSIGKYIITGGIRTRSIAIGIQITKDSFDLDLVFFWFAVERLTW